MILILVITSIFYYQVLGIPTPIVGGLKSHIRKFPWLASIQKGDYHECVGSIISKNLILTAAHCVFDCLPNSFIVRVGSSRTDSGGTWHKVIAIKNHEEFGILTGAHIPTLILNDVALLRVAPPIQFGDNVTNIELAKSGSKVIAGTTVSVAGWGSVTLYTSTVIELMSVDEVACSNAYGDKRGYRMKMDHLLCVAERGRDACIGDSGAPLTNQKNVQVGIVSSGVGCANQKFPGVYTNVADFRDWIDTNSLLLESLE